jgi:hypothetical protein
VTQRTPSPSSPFAELILNPVICTAQLSNRVGLFFFLGGGGGGMILICEGNNHFAIQCDLKKLDSCTVHSDNKAAYRTSS